MQLSVHCQGSVTWATERGEVKLVNISFTPCEGMIEGVPIISWLHNVGGPVTVSVILSRRGVFDICYIYTYIYIYQERDKNIV